MSLLDRLRAEPGLSYLFIWHDTGTVRHISDRTAVTSFGRAVGAAQPNDLLGCIGELASTAATSQTTVLRLCRELGVPGFRDLRVVLAAEYGRAPVPADPDGGRGDPEGGGAPPVPPAGEGARVSAMRARTKIEEHRRATAGRSVTDP